MKKNVLIIWSIFVFNTISTAQSIFPQWISNHPDSAYFCLTPGIVVDSAGNSYVLEFIQDTSTNTQNITGNYILKYDPFGQLLWTDTVPGFVLFSNKILLGKDGYIYIGSMASSGLNVSKINPNGNIIWNNNFPTVNPVSSLNNMAISDSMNIYLITTSTNLNTTEIVKCDSSGNLSWNISYDHLLNRYDRGNDIAIDHFGNVFAAIASMDSTTFYNYAIVKYSPAGQLLWQQRYNNFLSQFPYFIDVFQDSSIIVTGICYNVQGQGDYLTQKYSSTGNLVWSAVFNADSVINHPYNRPDSPTAMLVTENGSIAITGRCADSGMALWMNILYDPQGNLKWVRQDFDAISRPNCIVEDRDNHLLFGGDAIDPFFPYGMGISKYDTLGNLLWSSIYHNFPTVVYFSTQIGVDYWGNIYCTSTTRNNINFIMVTTLKYDLSVNIEEENSVENSVLVYPNPATDHITFQLDKIDGEATIQIYDELGREICRKKTRENLFNFSLEGYATGSYFYRVESNGENKASGKFIIQ